MALAATFLGNARSRLLPASIPFRFFGAAVVFQGLAWLALLAGAADAPHFSGGLGLPLAALHLVTLGVLVMTAIGASLQLLPVATRQPVGPPRAMAALWWCYVPGVALLTLAMAMARPWLLAAGAVLTVLALAGYALLLARNLLAAKGMPVVVVHGGAALVCLLLLLASGFSLAAAYHGHGLFDRASAVGLHIVFAGYGFMGMLVLGFSYILVPMFALSESPAQGPALASAAAAIGALGLAGLASFGTWPAALWPAAIGLGLAALGLHVALMVHAQRTGMRPKLGRPLVLVRIGWAGLAASLLAALALALDAPFARLATLFGVLLVGGLLSVLLGMLSRIVPFLAAMHAAGGKRGAPLPSALTAERPLAVHFGCHLVALALLLAAVLIDSAALTQAAGAVGAAGALAFARFFVLACRRMRTAPAAAAIATHRV
jgi:hypothetical protein